jgi:hypothetical protein
MFMIAVPPRACWPSDVVARKRLPARPAHTRVYRACHGAIPVRWTFKLDASDLIVDIDPQDEPSEARNSSIESHDGHCASAAAASRVGQVDVLDRRAPRLHLARCIAEIVLRRRMDFIEDLLEPLSHHRLACGRVEPRWNRRTVYPAELDLVGVPVPSSSVDLRELQNGDPSRPMSH